MTGSRGDSSPAPTPALPAFLAASLILAVVFLPVAKRRFYHGTAVSPLFFDRDAPCGDCHGRGKVSLLGKWNQQRKIVAEPRLMLR
jgi:hypothetical protein